MMSMRRHMWWSLGLILLGLIGLVSMSVGAMGSSLSAAIVALMDPENSLHPVLMHVRLPRILGGLVIGAGLGVAGAAMQAIFRNSLADPGLVGVSSGAALGAVLAIVVLPGLLHPATLSTLAAFGGLLATWAVWGAAHVRGASDSATLVLAGVAINAFAGAAIGLLTFVSNEAQLRNLTVWMLGSLAGLTWAQLALLIPVTLVCAFGIWWHSRLIDAYVLGDEESATLGINVRDLRRRVIALSAVLVAVGVSFTGIIGFVGLVVPHLVRMLSGPRHSGLLIGSAIMGAGLLMLSDLFSRSVAVPMELPIGVVTSAIGAPFFLYLLRRRLHGAWA